jgi:hypothetical protein
MSDSYPVSCCALRLGWHSLYQPALRSCHAGFFATISAIFLIRRQPLICFSRVIALPTYWKRSKYTSRSSLYCAQKLDPAPCLCSQTRRIKLLVAGVKRLRPIRHDVNIIIMLTSGMHRSFTALRMTSLKECDRGSTDLSVTVNRQAVAWSIACSLVMLA